MYIYFFGNINILATFVEIRKGCVYIIVSGKRTEPTRKPSTITLAKNLDTILIVRCFINYKYGTLQPWT